MSVRISGVVLAACVGLVVPRSACSAAHLSAPDPGPVFTEKAAQMLGIYEALPAGEAIRGIANTVPRDVDPLPLTAAAHQEIENKPAIDPKDACQVLGPFRLMARSDIKFEILRDAPNKFVLLFEKSSWGHVRTIRLDAEHVDFTHVRPMWNGDSTASWEGGTLVIDSVHFTDKTWLDERGVLNSKQLHLTERFRLVAGGTYLEYQATAVDPDVLTAPVSYLRYFKRTSSEITEDNCFAHRPAQTAVSK